MSALFGTPSRSTSKNLVEFKAGKMSMSGKTVTPDTRKGQVFVYQSDDGLMHFCWKDRKTAVVEDDLIIFPEDIEYKRVAQCTTGRVFVLRFKSSSRKFFFWMQESKTDKDEEYCTKVNETLNSPPVPGTNRSNVSTPSGLPSELSNLVSGESDLQNLLSGMSQQQLISLLSGGGAGAGLSGLLGNRRGTTTRTRNNASSSSTQPASTSSAPATPPAASTPASTAAAATNSSIRLSDLRNILSNMSVPTPADGSEVGPTASSTAVDLSNAMTAEALQPVLSNPDFLQRLQQFLPTIGSSEQLPSAQQLRGTLQSPQFQQALSLFSSALQSGQLAPLIQQFGLGDEAVAAAADGNMEDFVRALQDQQQLEDRQKNAQENQQKE